MCTNGQTNARSTPVFFFFCCIDVTRIDLSSFFFFFFFFCLKKNLTKSRKLKENFIPQSMHCYVQLSSMALPQRAGFKSMNIIGIDIIQTRDFIDDEDIIVYTRSTILFSSQKEKNTHTTLMYFSSSRPDVTDFARENK